MASGAKARAAKRDYWNSPKAVRIGKTIDRAIEVGIAATFIILASINF